MTTSIKAMERNISVIRKERDDALEEAADLLEEVQKLRKQLSTTVTFSQWEKIKQELDAVRNSRNAQHDCEMLEMKGKYDTLLHGYKQQELKLNDLLGQIEVWKQATHKLNQDLAAERARADKADKAADTHYRLRERAEKQLRIIQVMTVHDRDVLAKQLANALQDDAARKDVQEWLSRV
jgi:uncharacterized phage infection (PIP) family protein YhgE